MEDAILRRLPRGYSVARPDGILQDEVGAWSADRVLLIGSGEH